MLLSTRRALGAYYTPADLAEFVASWAIDRSGLRVLEPSVGSGALIDAALQRFAEVGSGSLVGFEIDASTIERLGHLKDENRVEIIQGDFLATPSASEFDVVIANPPFTRNHELSPASRLALRAGGNAEQLIRGAPGLWIYFILASLPHLRRGGRLAFVVPGAVEFVDYAKPVLEHLRKHFAAIEIVTIEGEVAWEGAAQERAAVILASGYDLGVAKTIVWRRSGVGTSYNVETYHSDNPPTRDHTLLGQLATLEIGVVTGANNIFLLNLDQAKDAHLRAEDFTLAVARARHTRGIAVSAQDLADLAREGERTLLLTPTTLGTKGSPVHTYLAQVSKTQQESTVWFAKRNPWWRVQLGQPFDGVLTYMNHFGPKLALIEPGISATNTLHKVTFHNRDKWHQRNICISMLTTYTQLHAETVGRTYGGGVLKFELKDARRLPILLPDSEISPAVFARIDTALRSGAYDQARRLADAAVLPSFFGPSWQEARAEMDTHLTKMRALRGVRSKRTGGQ